MNVMTNQVDQMYVVSAETASYAAPAAKGEIQVLKSASAGLGRGDEHYFKYMGAAGLTRTDLLKEGQIMEVKVTDADAQAKPLHRVVVSLDSTVNTGLPIPGEDYELKIAISQFQDIAEDSIYFKYGFVHATTAGTPDAKSFYKVMAKSLATNFAREITKFFKFYVTTNLTTLNSSTMTEVTPATDLSTLTGTYLGIVIEELKQDHVGPYATAEGVNFKVTGDKVTYMGDEVEWAAVAAPVVYAHIDNGSELASMEYFYMGERGDQYRMFDHPLNRIPTEYMVNPAKKYDVINIHYFFVDSLGGVQKSEKDITLLVEHTSGQAVVSSSALNSSNAAAALVGHIKTALGVTTVKAVDASGNEILA